MSPTRSARVARLAASALLAAALGACLIDYDFENTSFACADGVCPSGFECVAARCVQGSSGGDAGTSADAAISEGADAAA